MRGGWLLLRFTPVPPAFGPHGTEDERADQIAALVAAIAERQPSR